MTKITVFILLIILNMTAAMSIARDTASPETLRVLWTVSDYKILDHSVVSDKEAATLISKPLDIDDTSITFDGSRCGNVVFQRETIDTQDYFLSRHNISAQTLGVSDPVIQLTRTTCDLPGFSEYMRLRDRRIAVIQNGLLLFFSPWVNY